MFLYQETGVDMLQAGKQKKPSVIEGLANRGDLDDGDDVRFGKMGTH